MFYPKAFKQPPKVFVVVAANEESYATWSKSDGDKQTPCVLFYITIQALKMNVNK